ncbi:hypothetical protein ACSZMM_06140 [Aeromonas caviae]|uniref:hypothetical protein n=1 Tax=Aeromonas TaxID=642 RepID=UPI000CDDAD2B|nr:MULTISPECIES: hypothetical protein [Aeromonas]POV93666.1 hypothetical protein C3418_01320 [Aeromonas sp. ASNIH8]BDO09040.1 hypothetical protein KAM643c_26130 [Aeromonas caviae]GKR79828.1 hypothetical protein KAM481_32980 [Aeromonas caviae]
MLTAIMLFTAACNVYLLLQLRRSTRLLEASHASLLAAVSRLQARQVAVEKVVIDPSSITGTLSRGATVESNYPYRH